MALAVTSLNASGSTTDATSGVTGSVSPAAGSLLVLWVCYAIAGGGTISSVSDTFAGTSAWTNQKSLSISSSTRIDCWTAVAGASPGSGAVTFNFSTTMGSWNWDLDQVTGENAGTPLVTSNTLTSTQTLTADLTLTFATAASPGNLFMLAVGAAANITETPSETPAWTELFDGAQSTPSCSLETQVSPNVTNLVASATPSATSTRGGIGIELAAASAAAPVGAVAQPGQTWLRRFHHRQMPQSFTAAVTAVQAGPPIYPLGHPVQARQLPQAGGRTSSRAGVYAQLGPPVKPAAGPVRARIPQPVRGGQAVARRGPFGGVGPAVKALASAVVGRLRGLPPRGRTAGRTGVYAQLGPPVRQLQGPEEARRLPARGGSAQGRAGTFTAVALGSGPPVYPLGHPVQARRQPAQGGHAGRAVGVYGGTGAPVRHPQGPVKAQPAPARGGRVASRAGTLTAGAPQAGPSIYPLGHPVQARRQPAQGGRVVRAAGTYAGTGPPVIPLRQPVGLGRRQPPPPARGRTGSQRGPYRQTGPPTIPLRRPVRGQPQRPVRNGRAAWRTGIYTAPIVAPFTVGTLTASTAPGATLAASAAPSGVTATATATAALTALTAAGAGTGAYTATYPAIYTAPGGSLTAADKRTGGPG